MNVRDGRVYEVFFHNIKFTKSPRLFFSRLRYALLILFDTQEISGSSGGSKGGGKGSPPGVQILSISCSFWEILAKSYRWRVGAPT